MKGSIPFKRSLVTLLVVPNYFSKYSIHSVYVPVLNYNFKFIWNQSSMEQNFSDRVHGCFRWKLRAPTSPQDYKAVTSISQHAYRLEVVNSAIPRHRYMLLAIWSILLLKKRVPLKIKVALQPEDSAASPSWPCQCLTMFW